MKKRWGSFLLAVCMALSLAIPVAGAEKSPEEDGFQDFEVKVTEPNPDGVTVNLFDYWLTKEGDPDNGTESSEYAEKGINKDHVLKFLSGGDLDPINQWTESAAPRQEIVRSTLGEDGYPVLNRDVTNSEESLRYLFSGQKSDYKKPYLDVGGLLQQQGGYYVYNSRENFASYKEEKNSFVLYNEEGVQAGGLSPNGQFFPFNTAGEVFDITDSGLEMKNGVTSISSIMNHYFGVSMSTRFVQVENGISPADGRTPITYEFSGDDDVWIFIDDVLVADLGGIHDAASVSIDFSTGEIVINKGKENLEKKSTLKSAFEEAGKGGTGWKGNTFADDTYHTLKFFYLERGNTDSNMYLKFNLVTRLESEIKKVDQDGEAVPGARFALYQANRNYEIINNQAYATGTTDESGAFVLQKKADGLPILPSDLKGVSDHWVLKETSVPEGYRGVGEIHLECKTVGDEGGEDGYPILLSRNQWDVGAYAMAKVMTTAETTGDNNGKWVRVVAGANPPDGMEENQDGEVKIANSEGEPIGTMFAVILKKGEKAIADSALNELHAVYGNPEDGWEVTDQPGMEGVVEAAQENWYPFTLNAAYQFVSSIENLPGDIETYYLLEDDKAAAEYTGGYFYSTAMSPEGVTADNTVMLDPTEFDRQFAMRLYVPNIQNRLLVQKTDEEGNPLNGATFALYEKDSFDPNTGTGEPPEGIFTTEKTGDLSLDNDGKQIIKGAMAFTGIPKGEYYLVETAAPAGFEKNSKPVHVVVDDTGVHADAGDTEDGVSVTLGVGKLVKSMVQFAEDDDVDATLHDIKAVLETGTYDQENSTLSWIEAEEDRWDSENPKEIMHLSYSTNSAILEYGPIDGYENALTYDNGWGRLSIRQCMKHDYDIQSPKQNLGERSLNNLFSGTTMVVVQNEPQEAGTLSITKNVEGLDEDTASLLSFDITLTADPVNLNGGTVYRMTEAGTPGKAVEFEDGQSTLSIHGGETINLQVPAGVTITVEENASENFNVTYTVDNDEPQQGPASVMIGAGSNSTVTITNRLEDGSAVMLVPEVTKQFTGSGWNTGDEVSFQITAVEQAGKKVPMPDPATITIEKTNENEATASFGPIFYREAGTYQYKITETKGNLSNVTYDRSEYTLSVDVKVEGSGGGLTIDNWTITKDGQSTDSIVFTNYRSGGGHHPDPDPDPDPGDDKPSLNTEDHYGYIIGYPVDYDTGLPTDDQTKKPVKPEGNITRAEVATIYFRMLTDESRNEYWSQESGYPDVELTDWFNNAISTLSNGGIISGYPDGTFDPNGYITRAEFAAIAARFFDMDYQGEDLFPDIDGHWAQDYINQAAENGFIEGYPDGTFGPDKYITRAEAVTLVNRTLDRHPDPDHFLEDMLVWPDNLDTEAWYYADMQEATNSHEYQVKKDAQGNEYEVWTKVLPVRDWEAFEKEWSDANAAENPGDVVREN